MHQLKGASMFFSTKPTQNNNKNITIPSCPACKKSGKKVSETTIKAQLKKEKRETVEDITDAFCFCTNPSCSVVYYSDSTDTLFYETDIKSKVTIKNDDPSTPLCYCHKYKKADAIEDMKNLSSKELVKKIKAIISQDKSFCQKSNPKGSCCTQDIKDFLASHEIAWENPIKLTPVSPVSTFTKG